MAMAMKGKVEKGTQPKNSGQVIQCLKGREKLGLEGGPQLRAWET